MTQCATHVNYQLPNENTRVTYLLDAIDCADAPLQAAMALVRNDTEPHGKMNDFEATAAFILPHDPVAKKRSTAKRPHAEVSATTMKSGIGKTGVPLRWHTSEEYAKLPRDQRAELSAHRDAQEASGKGRNLSANLPARRGGKRGGQPKKPRADRDISAVVAEAVAKEFTKELNKSKKAVEEETEAEQLQEYILSVVNSSKKSSTKAPESTPSIPKTATIQSILKRAKPS